MTLAIAKIVVVIIVAVLFVELMTVAATSAEEVDCSKRRPSGLRAINDCCPTPRPSLEAYRDQCKDVKVKNMRCHMACAFNVTGSLDGSALHLTNLRTLLEKSYPNNLNLVEAYLTSFEDCIPKVKPKVDGFMMANGTIDESKRRGKCSSVPMMYASCAHSMLLKNCPVDVWKRSEMCESAKVYAETCGAAMWQGGMGGRRRGGSGQYNASTEGRRNGNN